MSGLPNPRQFIRRIDERYCIPKGVRIVKVIGWEDVQEGTGTNTYRVYICLIEEVDE